MEGASISKLYERKMWVFPGTQWTPQKLAWRSTSKQNSLQRTAYEAEVTPSERVWEVYCWSKNWAAGPKVLPGDCSLWIKEQSVGKVPPSEVVSEEIAKVLSTAADSSLLKHRCLGLIFRDPNSVGIRWNYKSAYSPRSPMMLTSWLRNPLWVSSSRSLSKRSLLCLSGLNLKPLPSHCMFWWHQFFQFLKVNDDLVALRASNLLFPHSETLLPKPHFARLTPRDLLFLSLNTAF